MTPCSLVEMYRSFEGKFYLSFGGYNRTEIRKSQESIERHSPCYVPGLLTDVEDEANIFFRNIDGLVPDYTTSHPRGQNIA
jgi:hypothetical protein